MIAENYHECYHCPLIHPELCQVSPPSSGYNIDAAWRLDRRHDGAARGHADDVARRASQPADRSPGCPRTTVLYMGLVPNLLISAHPDYVMAHRLVPLSPGTTWVECSWYVPDTGDGPPIDAAYAVEFWDITNKQDWRACESVQRGLASPHFQAWPVQPQ